MKQQKAFTIIELLIVVLILGTLATIAIPMFQGMVIKARLTQALVDVNRIEKEIDMYITEYGCDIRPFRNGDVTGINSCAQDLSGGVFRYTVMANEEPMNPNQIKLWDIMISTKNVPPVSPNDVAWREINPNSRIWHVFITDHPWAKYFSQLLRSSGVPEDEIIEYVY